MIFVQTLGTATIDVGPVQIRPHAFRMFALGLYLWAERGHRVPRATLYELILPEQPEKNAAHSLRQLMYQLRHNGARFESNADGFLVDMEMRSDYSDVIGAAGVTVEQLDAIGRGFLTGYAPDHSVAYANWLDGLRARAASELCKVAMGSMHRARAVGDWAMVERAARACIGQDSLHEEATLGLAESLAMRGAKTRALAVLDRYTADVGEHSVNLKLPAETLRLRIRERLPDGYQPNTRHRFVGRDREMLTLRERFHAMRGGTTQCVAISGEAGIGKTRLAHEFLNLAAMDGARVERCSSQPHDVHRPMGAFIDVVPALLRLPGALGSNPESLNTLNRLTTHAVAADQALPTERQIEELAFATSKAIMDLTDAIAAESPLVLAFDDTHWMDRLSVQTIGALVSSPLRRRLLIVITTRELQQFANEFRHAANVRLVALRGLGDDASTRLVHEALGDDDARDKATSDRIVAKSGGNPLYALTMVAESRTAGPRFTIPNTLRELMLRRLDALSPVARALLQSCTSLGRHSTLDRVTRVLVTSPIEILNSISELSGASLIESTESEIRISHPLIADALPEHSPPAWTSVINRRVAEVLQADADEEQASALWWDCAERWFDCGEHEHALFAFRRCARHAIEIGQPGEAARILDRALSLDVSEALRNETARELIVAADFATEFSLVLRGAEVLRARNLLTEHDHVELAVARATVSLLGNSQGIVAQLTSCMKSPSATLAHRVRAATWLLKHVDTHGLAHCSWQTATRFTPAELSAVDRTVRLEFELIYNASLGNLAATTRSATCARHLLAACESSPAPERLSLMRNSAFALLRAGHPGEALEAYKAAFVLAGSIGTWRGRANAAAQVAAILHDVCADVQRDEWIRTAEQVCVEHPEYRFEFDYITVRTDIAFADGDESFVAELLESVLRNNAAEHNHLLHQWGRATAIGLRAGHESSCLREDFDAALAMANSTSFESNGLRDFEMAMACRVFMARGLPEQAAAHLRRYASFNVERRRPFARSVWTLFDKYGVPYRANPRI